MSAMDEDLLLTSANQVRKCLQVRGMLPPNMRFIKLRYDLDGTFSGIQLESLAMSSYEAAQLRPKTDKRQEKATI